MGVQSAEPMHQALETIRRGGRIVILGVLDIQVPREPFFYKEAEIAISRAAGPGRYDPHYERDGTDYPLQYCRWTEGRNLAEALRLIASGRLRVDPLISARYPIARFGEPYRRILEGEPGLGYLLDWTTL
jgi:threonine dehydrogenase-like Zn-dependent dehydrogenase